LWQNLHAALADMSREFDQGILVLRGRVLCFYHHKQLAQEAVARVAGAVQIVNEIQVVG